MHTPHLPPVQDMQQTQRPYHIEELALAKACHAGDRHAQFALWKRFKNQMFGVCLRFTGSRAAAEDLLQDAFVHVFQDIGHFRGEGSLEGWVRRIVVRTALAQLDKKRLETYYLEELDADLPFDILSETADQSDEADRLVQLLQQLPSGYRAVLNLYVIEEKSHEEIARELGISVGTSKSQLNRAKAFFRNLMDKMLLLL